MPLQAQKERTILTNKRRNNPTSTSGASRTGSSIPVRCTDLSVCSNAFWALAPAGRKADDGAQAIELAKDGYEHLMGRMKMGSRTLEELRAVYRERWVLFYTAEALMWAGEGTTRRRCCRAYRPRNERRSARGR